MLQYLYNTYAKISPADLKTKADAMSKLYDPNKPFEALIQQVQDAVDFADHRGAPFTQEQILNTAYNLVYQAGVFADNCKDWRNHRAPLARDWPAFKRFFAERYNDWAAQQQTTCSGYFPSAKPW